MLCVAYTESRYELAATNGVNVGPWQINLSAHPWVDGWRVTQSWRYAAAVAHRLAWTPPSNGHPGFYSFHPWTPDCGIG